MSTSCKKDYVVSVRFSQEEREKLTKEASANQQTLSEFIRESALEALEPVTNPIIQKINHYVYFELGKVTEYIKINGLNNESLNNLQELINEIRLELIGLRENVNNKNS